MRLDIPPINEDVFKGPSKKDMGKRMGDLKKKVIPVSKDATKIQRQLHDLYGEIDDVLYGLQGKYGTEDGCECGDVLDQLGLSHPTIQLPHESGDGAQTYCLRCGGPMEY